MMEAPAAAAATCPSCGTAVGPAQLACPSCHALLQADRLKALAAQAGEAAARGDVAAQLEAWRAALLLVPDGTAQHRVIGETIAALVPAALDGPPAGGAPQTAAGHGGAFWKTGGLATGALLAWKFKAVLLALLGKGKLLLFGLTKASTLFSMFATVGLYWTRWGLLFAAGLVASIYVHEMGHVAALKRLGIPASAPMFLPGIGAVVRLKQAAFSPAEDARIGLAGPVWGTVAALLLYVASLAGGWPLCAALAQVGAWINLFNLLPVWQLDGGRAFTAMSRRQRLLAAGLLVVLFALTREGLLVLLAATAVVQAWRVEAAAAGDRRAFTSYASLATVLAALCLIPVTGI